MIKLKKWMEFLMRLGRVYGTGDVRAKDFQGKDKVWLCMLWRWGYLTRLREGVYVINKKGWRKIETLKRGGFYEEGL